MNHYDLYPPHPDAPSPLPESFSLEDLSEWPAFHESSLLESTISELSYSMEVTREMAGMAVLGVMASACQGLFDVTYPNGKTTIPTSLMTCTIAGSSERKTTIKNWTDRPIKEFEAEQIKSRQTINTERKRHHNTWKIKIKSLEKSLSKEMAGESEPEAIRKIERQLVELNAKEPETHKNIRVVYENVTPAALSSALYENLPYAFLSSSEAGNLLNGPTFRDLYIFNSIYSGETITIDRASQPCILLSEPRLSISLMLQSSSMERFLNKKGREAHDNGFLARFLFIIAGSDGWKKDKREATNS